MTAFTRETDIEKRPQLFDIAKALNKVGYPQTFGFSECEHQDSITIYDTGKVAIPEEIPEDVESFYIPDIDSLIEHCGGRFKELSRATSDRWHARGENNGTSVEVAGETPWEAVAKLYIELAG